ncbi:MAG: hypothetical protein KAW02_04900 [candidate division Zixibacteria bacterium]|nr:hypothetical protein [candidate division Zixibacteria bacterium]
MKRIVVVSSMVLLLFFAFQCDDKKKPNNPRLEDPSYYFPINLHYKWTYAILGNQCSATGDTFVITAETKNNRIIDGVSYSGWDMVTSPGGGISFVYRVGDSIFYKKNVNDPLPPYMILVGPIRVGTVWKGTSLYGYEYRILGFEDLYSPIANDTYSGCAKVERTSSDDSKTIKYFWWAPQKGKVKEAVYQSGECQQGEELKRLDKPPDTP